MIIRAIARNKMFAVASVVLLFAVFGTATDSCICGNETGHEPKVLQGAPGKRGPPGPPASVFQCGYNTTEVLKKLKTLSDQMESYNENREKHEIQHSCKTIKEIIPDSKSGYYNIRDSYGQEYATFCDMETNGGGWTLVASVHDNNPFETGRCTTGDRWSSEHGTRNSRWLGGDGNWVNLNTFGRATTAAFDDFKSPGFFELQANDMMIWHVPNDTPFRNFSSAAYVKYRTSNGFFSQYGGNLQSLFSNHLPIISRVYDFRSDQGLAIPVVFDKGSPESLRQHIAPSLAGNVDVGYIHFPATRRIRKILQMCAGFKVRGSSRLVRQGCLGSRRLLAQFCGDTTLYYESDEAYKTGWTASELLVKTTYLMFYR